MSGAWYVHLLQGRVSWALADNVTSIRAALRLQLAIQEMRDALEEYSITRQSVVSEKGRRPARKLGARGGGSDSICLDRIRIRDHAENERRARAVFGVVRQSAQTTTEANPAGATPLDRNVNDQLLVSEVLPYVKQYLDFNEAELSDRSHDNEAMASWLVAALGSLRIGGAAAGAAVGYALARGIRRTVFQLSIPLRDVAGRLNQVVGPVEIDENPAIEDLEGVLKRIATEVNSVIEKFHATHRQVLRADQLAALGQLAAGPGSRTAQSADEHQDSRSIGAGGRGRPARSSRPASARRGNLAAARVYSRAFSILPGRRNSSAARSICG